MSTDEIALCERERQLALESFRKAMYEEQKDEDDGVWMASKDRTLNVNRSELIDVCTWLIIPPYRT